MMFDDLDKRIVDILTADARTSNREVARALGVSETAVRKRLRRLEDLGAVRIAAVVNPVAIGLELTAFVRITTAPGTARKIAEAAAALDQFSFVALTTGRFNVIALVTAAGRRELADLIHSELRHWDGVLLIEAAELVSNTKHQFDLVRVRPNSSYGPSDGRNADDEAQ